jgi:hypothetical protein
VAFFPWIKNRSVLTRSIQSGRINRSIHHGFIWYRTSGFPTTLASNPTIYSTPPSLSSSLLSSSSVKRAAAMASRLLQIANKACRASRAAAVAASRAASLASRSARAAAADAARISAALDPESCPKTKPREAVTKLPAFPTMITFAAPHSSNCQVNQSSLFLHLINSLCLCNYLCVSYYM